MFSQQSLLCSLQRMKNKAHNLQLAVNVLFLFKIIGKCRLSMSEEYLVYFSSHVAKSKRPISARRTKYKTICVCFHTENWKHFVTRGVTELLWKQYSPRHFDIQCKSLLPSSIPAHILQGGRSTYFAQFRNGKVQSLHQTGILCDSLLSSVVIYYQLRIWPTMIVL